jgi:microcystin-dependent protein
VPLETATFINQLVTSNPAHSDGLNNADAHLRLIKGVLQAQFPNFTAVALASTEAQIDAAVAATQTTGATVLAESGPHFATNTGDGLTNPSAGIVGISTGATVATTFSSGGIGTTSVAASVGFTGPGAFPIGGIMPWPMNTLPSGNGVWAWCNGQAISRSTYATLYALMNADGLLYGTGDGVTTFNLPNYQDITLVGKDTMGGASSPGLLTSIASGLKGILGKIFGADTRTLITANLPPYTPAGTIAVTQNANQQNTAGSVNGGGSSVFPVVNAANITAAFTGTAQGGTSTAFGILPPMMTVNYIIRIA